MCKYLYNDLYTTKNLEQCKTTMLMTIFFSLSPSLPKVKHVLNDKTQSNPRWAPAKP